MEEVGPTNKGGIKHDPSFQQFVNQRWNVYFNKAKENLTGTDSEKNDILRKRIIRFFQDYHIHTDNFYVQRKDVSQNIDPGLFFQNCLLIHGIDFLSFQSLRNYFVPYQVKISLFDDSHCSIEFSSFELLVECLFGKLLAKTQTFRQLFDFFVQNPMQMGVWRQITGYTELMFERKLYARFLTKQDEIDKQNGSYGRKMMSFFQKAKHNFLLHMEKNPKYNLNSREHKKRYGKGWRSQTNSSCSNCQENLEKLKELFGFSHHKMNQIKEEEQEEDHYHVQKPFGFKKKKWTRNKRSMKLSNKPKLRPIIAQITGGGGFNNISSGTRPIPNSANRSNESLLFNQMLNEFSKYTPFDCDLSNVENTENMEVKSEPDVSYYEVDRSDA